MSKERTVKYNDNDRLIVATLKNYPDGLTISEFNEIVGSKLVPAQFTNAKNKHLVAVIGEREISRPSKRKVATYAFVTADVLNNEDGKAYNYTDDEKSILGTASQMEGDFTLGELSEAYGSKLASGNINGLVKKGNIQKVGEVTVAAMSKDTVKVWGYLADVPADAE